MGTMAALYLAQDEGFLQESEISRIKQLYQQMGITTVFQNWRQKKSILLCVVIKRLLPAG